MEDFGNKLKRSIEQEPPYESLSTLSHDVWQKVRENKVTTGPASWFHLTLTPAVTALSLVLVLGSCLALSQISFDKNVEPDLFDLRYFSSQSLATTNLLSINSPGSFP